MIQNKMDFSMYMKRFFIFCTLLITAACTQQKQQEWFSEYGTLETGTPSQMQYGSDFGTPSDNFVGAPVHRMAVLLPLSGDSAAVGKSIRTSIETAVLQNAPQNLSVSFHDTLKEDGTAITDALSENPEIILGPVFSKDTQNLKSVKPENLPVLSFTSDASALGNGVMTMALMPTNSVEAIVKEMQNDGIKNILILAPQTKSGELMAGTALKASEIYNMPAVGIFFYKENDSESIKETIKKASMNDARTAANTKAREILSDILTKERLTAIEKSSLTLQLEKLSKMDTLGKVPYDAVLFLGNADDSKNLASFLRYYGVDSRAAKFYGTAMWEGSDIVNDFTMQGAKYAILPETSPEFSNLYEQVSGKQPNRLATFGYDAANMAIGMIYSPKSDAAYLLDPSGYIGTDGLFRLKPTGESERALRIVKISNNGELEIVRDAPSNFLTPVYNIEQHNIKPAKAKELETAGINPSDYIKIPQRLESKYRSKTFGANTNYNPATVTPITQNIVVLQPTTNDVIVSPDFQPVSLETVNRTFIDSIEIEE